MARFSLNPCRWFQSTHDDSDDEGLIDIEMPEAPHPQTIDEETLCAYRICAGNGIFCLLASAAFYSIFYYYRDDSNNSPIQKDHEETYVGAGMLALGLGLIVTAFPFTASWWCHSMGRCCCMPSPEERAAWAKAMFEQYQTRQRNSYHSFGATHSLGEVSETHAPQSEPEGPRQPN